MKSEFLSTLSHELRAPLNAIIGFSEALKDGLVGPMSDAQHEYIGEIFTSGQQLLSLINETMDSSKVAAGVMALDLEAVDLNPPNRLARKFEGTDPGQAAVGPGKRIALVVEDNDQSAKLIRLLLEAEGFTVLRAVSAEDALLLAPGQILALITLDLQMYGINGWQFLQRIRESSALAHVPVVIISGQPVGNLALTRGAAAVLQKPISRARLKVSLADAGLLMG